MTKEEKIKEAYGEYWEYVKDIKNVNNNGSFEFKGRVEEYSFNGKFKILWIGVNFFIAVPFDLIGIENNNGWIDLKGLPKEIKYKGDIWIENKSGGIEYIKEDEFLEVGYAIAYQPVIKPKKRIY